MQSPFILARDDQEWSEIEVIAKVISNIQRLVNLSMPRFCPCRRAINKDQARAKDGLFVCLLFTGFILLYFIVHGTVLQ